MAIINDLYERVESVETDLGALCAFPIGSVFIAVVSTNPETLLGYGNWQSVGSGLLVLGSNPGGNSGPPTPLANVFVWKRTA